MADPAEYPIVWSTDDHTTWLIEPLYDEFSATPGLPVPLAGAVSCTARFQLATAAAGTGVTGTGSGAIAAPYVSYKPSVADLNPVAGFGLYIVQISIVYSDASVQPLKGYLVNILEAV